MAQPNIQLLWDMMYWMHRIYLYAPMIPYCHWFHQGQPYAPHQTTLWMGWCSSYWRIPKQSSMCRKKQVDKKVFRNGPRQGPRGCLKCCLMPHMHKVSVVLHIWHEQIWVLIGDDNVWLDPALHGVSRVSKKGNSGNWVVGHDIFTVVCSKSLMYWTW